MDPNATLRVILTCIASGEHKDAREYLDSLEGWLAMGGFAPDLISELAYACAGETCPDCDGEGTVLTIASRCNAPWPQETHCERCGGALP